MPEFDGISQFRKAAVRRLRDGEKLLDSGIGGGADALHLRGAVYLSGYAVECMLKVYFIDRQPPAKTLSAALEQARSGGREIPNILGAEGHNLQQLIALTDLEEALDRDTERKKDWGVCLRWKSTWRYDPEPPSLRFAEEFVSATRRVMEWVERRI